MLGLDKADELLKPKLAKFELLMLMDMILEAQENHEPNTMLVLEDTMLEQCELYGGSC